MATFVLVHGAWHGAWCWRRVVRLLTHAGHDVVGRRRPSINPSCDELLGDHAHAVLPTWNALSKVEEGRKWPTRLSAGGLPNHQKYAGHAQYHANKRSHRQPLIENCPCH